LSQLFDRVGDVWPIEIHIHKKLEPDSSSSEVEIAVEKVYSAR
jgi:hypothetical protein